MRCFVSWSGGKDSCLALWRARLQGHEVPYLLTVYRGTGSPGGPGCCGHAGHTDESGGTGYFSDAACCGDAGSSGDTGRTVAHGFPLHLIRAQAEALGAELVPVRADWDDYEDRLKAAIRRLRERGVEAGVFGDIDLEQHREWVERVCREAGISAVLPLWGGKQEDLLQEWVDQGFEAVIVAIRGDALGLDWLGRPLDRNLVRELKATLLADGLSPSGEGGEYHTLVVAGPLFRKRIHIEEALPVLRGRHWMLDIRRFTAR